MDVRHLVLRAAALVCAIGAGAVGCEATVLIDDGGMAITPEHDPDDPDRKRRDADDGEPSVACEQFCREAGKLGCPETDDCHATCAAQYARSGGCTAELDALLACAPEHLAPPDQLDRYFAYGRCALTPFEPVPTGEEEEEGDHPRFADCDDQVRAFDECIEERTPALQHYAGRCWVTSPFLTRVVGLPRGGAGEMPNAIETSYMRCPGGEPVHEQLLKAWCNADGLCRCYVDHEEIGTCDMLLPVAGMVVAPASCCAPMFDEVLASAFD